MDYKNLKKHHPELAGLLEAERKRQSKVINLTASENFASPAVLEALGTVFTNKYAEGKAGHRYYFGTAVADEVENCAKWLALKLFKLSSEKWGVNVQPYSGSPANLAIYLALAKPGEKILAMDLAQGGHLTHGSPASITGKLWKFSHYGVDKKGFIDYAEVRRLARKHKPKIVVCGATAYSRTIDFKKFAAIAKESGAYLMADISHIAGLVAGEAHPSPFPYADVVMTTTHKSLRGPRGAVIFSRKESGKLTTVNGKLSDLIDRAVFPGLQGGPHLNNIFAMAVAFSEALKPEFRKYAKQIVKNAKTLAAELQKLGFPVVSGGTDNHLMLIDVTPFGYTGQSAGEALEKAGIVVNKNLLPYDARKASDPSGIRLGTVAVTTQSMKEKDMKTIAKKISNTLSKN